MARTRRLRSLTPPASTPNFYARNRSEVAAAIVSMWTQEAISRPYRGRSAGPYLGAGRAEMIQREQGGPERMPMQLRPTPR